MENVNDKNRKLIKALELISDYELMKPIDKIDGELIDATVDWSLRLQNKDITLSTEEIEKMVSMIPFEDDTEELKTNGEVLESRKVLKKNKVLFIAAVITILVTLLAIVSVAFEWSIFDELKNRFGSVADTPVNEEIVVDGVTVVMNGEYRDYTDIESALRSENISILYPQSLPNEIHIKKLMYYNENNINKLSIITTKDTLTIEVVFDSNMPKEIYDTTVFSEKINSLECYIIDMPDIKYTQIYFECKDKWYVFSGDKKQELVEIIENLKELE